MSSPLTVWIIADPQAVYVPVLTPVTEQANVVIGHQPALFDGAPEPDAVMCGMNLAGVMRELWPRVRPVMNVLKGDEWRHGTCDWTDLCF